MTDRERLERGKQDRADGITRRDFLKMLGAGFAALAAAGCKLRPPKEAIVPYADQPEGAPPGVSRWYASTCGGCPSACGVLVKSRDGRPIKMEGNPDHPLSRGGLCARGQATVLDLYDSERLRQPLAGASPASWPEVDAAVRAGLASARREGREIRVVSHAVVSPSLQAAVAGFLGRFPGARHVVYDSLPAAAIIEAHRRTHGRPVLPHYLFGSARAIVSFDADFLGTWISPVEFAKAWAANRRPEEIMSWHAQFEARLSATGANADLRVPLRPSQELAAALALGRLVASGVSWPGPLPAAPAPAPVADGTLRQTAKMLLSVRGRGLVVSGSADPAVQTVVNWINGMLGNYGQTLDISRPSLQLQGEAGAMDRLIAELEAGSVGALIVLDANPAQDHARAGEFAAAMAKAGLTAVLSQRRDETASLAKFVCVTPHALESWDDAEPVAGVVSLTQPLLSPLFDTRPAIESLLAWSGRPGPAFEFIQERWRAKVFPRQKDIRSFTAFWDEALRRGAVSISAAARPAAAFDAGSLAGLRPARRAKAGAFELVPYAGVALGDGRQANNPWLQELPDPVTKVSWGNCACLSPADAARLGVAEGRMVRLSAGGRALDLPAYVQRGQADGVVAVALGYGRKAAGPVAANFPTVKFLPIEEDPAGGGDVYPLCAAETVSVTPLPATVQLAKTQLFDSQEVPFTGEKRRALRETTLRGYAKEPVEASASEEAASGNGLWPRHDYKGRKWGLAINLTACTGCSACVVACQAENNIPVVGKAEVRKSREMHWLRIDRYFSGAPDAPNPGIAFQPMLCQHCDNAPCETVCPVLATVHSTEGLNMQVYNRCVGTRYCANNCPFKVRRFNWFDYRHRDLLQNLALNPDVTARTRGVMEKCSLCVQRIYSAKFEADSAGRALKDGDITPACAQSCPADAIVFGDLNDPQSRVSRLARANHSYRVLSELGVGPSVFYQVKVRNMREA
ncbi:MAG: 4Fe-4S dicluster domain-containing protein [Elusimicrobia bacterium]|nr:4Fe-4S dicluster domain-containing protein [Elusimicrobiota bacterium]